MPTAAIALVALDVGPYGDPVVTGPKVASAAILALGLILLVFNRRWTEKLVAAEVQYGTDRQREQAKSDRVFRRKRIFAGVIAVFFCIGGILGLLE